MPRDLDIGTVKPGDLLAERAYSHIKRAILRNQLPPGTPLSVPELARQMEISRSPVREAVQRLIYDGLAENAPRRGAVVCQFQPDDFRLLLDVRELLEGLAARLAASHAGERDLEELRSVLDAHEEVVDTGEEAANVELDVAFHRTIRNLADNRHLDVTLGRLQSRAHHSLYFLWRGGCHPRLSLDEHRAIYDAIAIHDTAAAEEAAIRHIRLLRDRIPDSVEAYEQAIAPDGEPKRIVSLRGAF